MSTNKSKKEKFRPVLIAIVVIVIILGGIQLFFSLYLDSYVEDRLTSTVNEQTNGQYELMMDELNLSVWGRSFEMENIRLQPSDTASTAPKIGLEQFSINGIQFLPWLFSGSINVGDIKLSEPEISFVQNSADSLTFMQSSNQSSGKKKSREFLIDQFLVENGSITYWNQEHTTRRGQLFDFNLNIHEIRLDSSTQSSVPFFEFYSLTASTGNIRYLLNSDLYEMETEGINISTLEGGATIDSLKLVPQYPKYEFTQKVGHQLDRIDLNIEQILLQNFNHEKLNKGELDAEKLTINRANVKVFHSKLVPPAPESDEEKKFAHILFKNLGIPVTIDSIAIQQSEISYTEHLPDVDRPGKVTFADVNATFTDVTNDSTTISEGHEIILDVTTEVMNEALLDVHFTFPMHLNGNHSIRGTLESMDVAVLNPVLEPVGLIRAENGTIHSLQFLMDLEEEKSSGWTQLVYSDLKIQILDAGNVNEGGSQRIKTFLANALKIKANNDGEPLLRGEVGFERLKNKSLFNYWWKSLSSGLKDNIGL